MTIIVNDDDTLWRGGSPLSVSTGQFGVPVVVGVGVAYPAGQDKRRGIGWMIGAIIL